MADHKSDHAAHASHGDHAHEEHIHSRQHYVRVWLALVVLFFVSVAGPMLGNPIVTLITAFGIAVVKASMVVHFFMHLSVEKRFVHYFLATSLAFMFLFFFAVAPDVMKHEGTNWVNVAARETTARVNAEMEAGGGGHGEHGGGHAAPAEGAHH
jgi:caa(3)-type oxidase subunit IV